MQQAIDKILLQQIGLLNYTQKESIVALIRSFLSVQEQERVTIEQYNAELAAAEQRIEAGEYYTQEEIEKDAATW